MNDQVEIEQAVSDVEAVFSVNDEKLWEGTKLNIQWSMQDQGADQEGQQKMRHAASQANVDWMGEFKNGFDKTQRSPIVRATFHYFCAKDQKSVYNFGRSLLGCPPV